MNGLIGFEPEGGRKTFVLEHAPAEEGLGNREVPQTGVGGERPWWKEWENRGRPIFLADIPA